jgi:hypothetical protein
MKDTTSNPLRLSSLQIRQREHRELTPDFKGTRFLPVHLRGVIPLLIGEMVSCRCKGADSKPMQKYLEAKTKKSLRPAAPGLLLCRSPKGFVKGVSALFLRTQPAMMRSAIAM